VDYLPADTAILKKLIEESGIPFKPGKKSFIFDCPRCGKKQKLWMRRSDGRFKCFYCAEIDGFQGRPEFALRELLGLSIDELRGKLYGTEIYDSGEAALALELHSFWDDEEESPDLHAGPMEPAAFPYHFYPLTHPFAKKGLAYLEGRGLPLDVCAQYDLRYSPIQRRVIFPLKKDGVLYGWQARTIQPQVEWYDDLGKKYTLPKILTSTGAPRDRLMMFYDQAAKSEHLIVTEGPVDGLKCHMVGGATVSMGKAVSHEQARIILDHPADDVYLALDPDAAQETARLVRELSVSKRVYLLEPARGFKDLGEMPLQGVVEQFHRAQRITAGHLFLYLH
jgi:predicted RNA-binding Zn-ribbon protein involved in translation (DUF1610 family)